MKTTKGGPASQAGGATIDGASYTYDNAGNRTSKTNYLNGITENYTYDALYELTQVTQGANTTESYSYDPVGNRLSSLGVPLYNYNSSNELTSTSQGGYTYDANGNTLTDPSGRSFTWDFENRLTQVVNPGVGTTTLRYDPFGRRIQKSGPLGTTNYLYEGDNLLEEIDQSGNVLARYGQHLGIDQPLSEIRSGTASYYQQDGLGSVSSLSNSAGALAQTYTFDAFGNQTASSGSLTNPFRYTGREFDQETGIDYYRFRYYDPSAGRFISEDPIRFRGGIDFYAYTLNSPTNWTDSFGLEVKECRRPVHAPGAGDTPHTCVYSSETGTCYGLGPKGGFDILTPWTRVPSTIEKEKPYDDKGKLKPGYSCDAPISNDSCYEKCINKFGNSKPQRWYNLGEYQCDHWANDIEKQCRQQCNK